MKYLFILFFVLLGCKSENKNNPSIIETKSDVSKTINITNNDNKFNLNDIQGIWKSYSYYLEHEENDIDEHQNEYYKIIQNNKCIDIILKEHNNDSLILKYYDIGFVNNPDQYSMNSSLKSKGNYFVRIQKSSYINDNTIKVDNNYDVSESFSKTYDTYQIIEDGFNYNYIKNDYEKVQFKKEDVLPVEIYKNLQKILKTNKINFFKDIDIDKLSEKVKIIKSKTYFYEDPDLTIKKKAFLLENDEAFIENSNDKSVKVYFNGKVITSGYLNKNHVKIVD